MRLFRLLLLVSDFDTGLSVTGACYQCCSGQGVFTCGAYGPRYIIGRSTIITLNTCPLPQGSVIFTKYIVFRGLFFT